MVYTRGMFSHWCVGFFFVFRVQGSGFRVQGGLGLRAWGYFLRGSLCYDTQTTGHIYTYTHSHILSLSLARSLALSLSLSRARSLSHI